MKTPATMTPEEPKASKTPVGVTTAEYKLLCAMFVNGPKPEYDIPRLTKYLGSKSESYTKGRIQRLLKKIQQDAKDFDVERRLNTVEAIKDAAAAQVRGSKASPRKRAHEDNEHTNDNGNANKRHNLGNPSSLSAQITDLPSWEQHQQSQQSHWYHQEFLVPTQKRMNEAPPPAYTRLATTGTRVMNPAPVINSNNGVNQGVGMGMGMGMGMGSFSGAQMLGAEWLGNGFGHGLDGDAFSFGNSQVNNGLTFGAVAGSMPRAYQNHDRNGFGFPKHNGINGASFGNHPANSYLGNKNVVNGDVMGFSLPNGTDYAPFMDNTTFYDHSMRLGGGLMGGVDNAFANGFNGISGNTINGHAMEDGLQDSFVNPLVNHLTGSNPNRVAQNVPIATVSRPVQPVFQPVSQLSQNIQALNHQDINLNFNFIGQNGNGNGNTATNVQPNGVQQPEVAVPIPEEPLVPVPAPADEPTAARRLPTPVPTPANAEDAEDTYEDAMQQLQELQLQELQQQGQHPQDEPQRSQYQHGNLQEDEFQQDKPQQSQYQEGDLQEDEFQQEPQQQGQSQQVQHQRDHYQQNEFPQELHQQDELQQNQHQRAELQQQQQQPPQEELDPWDVWAFSVMSGEVDGHGFPEL